MTFNMESGTAYENPRTMRMSSFDRPLASRQPLKSEYEIGKSAWNNQSNIWRNGSGLLEGKTDEEAPKQLWNRVATTTVTTGADPPISSGPNSRFNTDFNSSRTANGAGLSPTDLQGPGSRHHTPWNLSTSGDAASQPTQPASPTKQRLHGFSINGIVGADVNRSDLLFDSAPEYSKRGDAHTQSGLVSFDSQRTLGNYDVYSGVNGGHHLHSNAQIANASRFSANSAARPSAPRLQSGTSPTQPPTGNSFSMFDGHQAMGKAMASSRDNPQSQFNWNGVSLYDQRHNPKSPTSSRPTTSQMNGKSANGHQDKSNALLDDTMRSMVKFNLFDDGASTHTSHEHSQSGLRQQPILPPSMSRTGASSRNGYTLGHSHFTNAGTPPKFYSSSEHQVSSYYPNSPDHFENGAQSPSSGDYRGSLQSPHYSATGTPPTGPDSMRSGIGSGISSRTSHHDPILLDRKLRSLEPYQIGYYHSSPVPTMMYNGSYDTLAHQSSMRMNPLATPYSVNGYSHSGPYSPTPPMPLRENDATQVVRSSLLEEFRMNNKTNKRYELRDIYNHIVEFSGDQHGSRFIQQKLETANSDEKDQVFTEIQPNSLQLMTDVFGNYVIQKMFEHGNQSQKKVLANNMKGHVLNLSLQMYGCRVVQKALEHVLTDQQASLVKELDGPNKQVLKVIRDQNGNHVIQKAIERVPAEHIQFIVEAHRGEVVKLATHTYGCRVIQRILEHCGPLAKRVILDELHGCVQPLITDSFGNYVVQHVIQNGEPDDRRRVVSIVQQQLLVFSKHKFASNVVEKCIEFADEDQRVDILRRLVGPNDLGQTPVLGLLRDQYGNYVIQKIFSLLKGSELDMLVAEMRVCFPQLKRTSYGKQVIAIEKLLYGASQPSSLPSSSSRSSEPSSSTNTNASSMVEEAMTPPTLQMTKQYVPLPLGSNANTNPSPLGAHLHSP